MGAGGMRCYAHESDCAPSALRKWVCATIPGRWPGLLHFAPWALKDLRSKNACPIEAQIVKLNKPVVDQQKAGDDFDWTAVMAAVATGVIFLFATAHGPNIYFTLGAFCFWIIFIAVRVRRDRNTLARWGFRTDNLARAARIPLAVFIVAALG